MDVGPDFAFMQAIRCLGTTSTLVMVFQSQSSTSTAQDRVVSSSIPAGLKYSASAAIEAECQGSATGGQMSVTSSQEAASVTGGDEKKTRTFEVIYMASHASALHMGANAIDNMEEASRKITKLAEEALSIDKQN